MGSEGRGGRPCHGHVWTERRLCIPASVRPARPVPRPPGAPPTPVPRPVPARGVPHSLCDLPTRYPARLCGPGHASCWEATCPCAGPERVSHPLPGSRRVPHRRAHDACSRVDTETQRCSSGSRLVSLQGPPEPGLCIGGQGSLRQSGGRPVPNGLKPVSLFARAGHLGGWLGAAPHLRAGRPKSA